MSLYSFAYSLLEKNLVPEFIIRKGIRKLIKQRLRGELSLRNSITNYDERQIQDLQNTAITVCTKEANEQHYEVPAEFYHFVLGKHLKYSSCLWYENNATLDDAEYNMLKLYCERAQIRDGMKILELGCGWGSLTLFLAEKFPNAQITAVSNSTSQKQYILAEAQKRGLDHIEIITADIKEFEANKIYDRIVSIEMLEHVRNHKLLFDKMAKWLDDRGKLFIHIFCHNKMTYLFDAKDESDWMSRYFFSGGIMPAFDLFERTQTAFHLKQKWKIDGIHYQKTSEAWLKNMKTNSNAILKLFTEIYKQDALKFYVYWQAFFMACAETFGFKKGQEWHVGHYLFEKNL